MRVGTARIDITPDRLIPLQGQMRLRLAERTRDPLTANAIAFDDGGRRVVVVSCDLCMAPDALVRDAQRRCEQRWGVPAASVLFAATHTHVGPCTVGYRTSQVLDEAYLEQLRGKLVRVVGEAIDDLEDAALFAGQGELEHMGWNRRGLHPDADHADMYWGSWEEGFVGVEGPRDGGVPVIWARRADGSVKAVVTGFATHPNCCEHGNFYSADLVGATRDTIRKVLGGHVGVVYLTGAAGNTAPSIMENNPDNRQPWRGEEGLERSGAYLGAEVVKVIMSRVDPMPDPVLALTAATLSIPMRPWAEDFHPETRIPPGPMREYYLRNRAHWTQWMEQWSPVDVRLNVLRLGDAVICTNPAELYVELGLAIKADSPAAVTMVSELTDGYCGYVPTTGAFERGGYSTWNAPTSKLIHDAGNQIVRATAALLRDTFAATHRAGSRASPTPST